jgi:hypothetical protein
MQGSSYCCSGIVLHIDETLDVAYESGRSRLSLFGRINVFIVSVVVKAYALMYGGVSEVSRHKINTCHGSSCHREGGGDCVDMTWTRRVGGGNIKIIKAQEAGALKV